jgi:hypothetical protein
MANKREKISKFGNEIEFNENYLRLIENYFGL